MERKIIFLGVMTLASLSFFTISMTQALFTDTATASSNTFSSASEFPNSHIADHLVINEVLYDNNPQQLIASNSSKSEWVEIYNPTSSSVDLTGWTVEDNNVVEILSGIIPAGGFLIISSASSTEFQTAWTVPVSTVFSQTSGEVGNGLANTGDILTLKNNSVVIDQMSWEGNNTGFASGCTTTCPGAIQGKSLERNPDGFDTDSSTDFVEIELVTPGS